MSARLRSGQTQQTVNLSPKRLRRFESSPRHHVAEQVAGGGADDGPGGSNSVVESQPSKLLVAGSIPVSRSSARATAPGRARRAAGSGGDPAGLAPGFAIGPM